MPAPARILAFDVLLAVERGAYASDLFTTRSEGADPRDAGLAYAIVFGVLRRQAQLDFLIRVYSGHERRLDPEVRIALRMAIFQIRNLERVPAHAAVRESVDLVRRARKSSAAGFVNAVLRKVDRAPIEWPDRATALSCPEWLLARWDRQYGAAASTRIAAAALEEPEAYIRVPAGVAPPDGALPTEVAGCYRIIQSSPGFRRQDIGAQAIVPLLDLRSTHTFLDLCAAPGNKTAQALESGPRAIACDLHLHRLVQLKSLAAPLAVVDGTQPLPFGQRFDRILLDAPCSGTGTLARNPEIKWRLRPDDLEDLQRRQQALLRNAWAALAPGGVLVYSTCSLEPEENRDAVSGIPPDRIGTIIERLPGRDPGDGFWAAVIKSD